MARHDPQMVIRLPLDLKEWIRQQSKRNGSSQNSEVVRAIQDRKERIEQCKEFA